MSKAVWKFPLRPDKRSLCEIEMPAGAQALTVDSATGEPCLWALVDPEATKKTRGFYIAGTGHPVPTAQGNDLRYVGTFFVPAGLSGQMMGMPATLVFHVFEVPQ